MRYPFLLALIPLMISAETKPQLVAGDPSSEARKVPYRNGDSVVVYAQYGWETIVVLPAQEKILDYFCGNENDWTVHVHAKTNFAALTPNKIGRRKSNVMLVAASGNIYTLELHDISADQSGHADTQVILNVTDDVMRSAINSKPKYVSSEDADAFREQAARAEEEAAKSREDYQNKLQAEQDKMRLSMAGKIRINYRYDQAEASKPPFNLDSLFHDDQFTYFRARSQEALSVYELKDGKPVAINMYPTGDGMVRLDRVVEQGYFRIGKKQLSFTLQGD
jgi:type IV secretory pathway VirB9-like protein